MTQTLRRNGAVFLTAVLAALLTAGLMAVVGSSGAGAATTCPTGGSITLQNSPCLIHGYKDGPVTLSNSSSFQTMATLPLPAGKFGIVATLHILLSGSPDFTPQNVDCRLTAGSDFDEATASWNAGNTFNIYVLSTAHAFPSAGKAVLACNTHGLNGFVAGFLRVTATRAGTLRKVALP